jgi:DNA-binding beta-propeller fold protein YncE
MMRLTTISALMFLICTVTAKAQPSDVLRLEKTIPLPNVQGRIDHMSIDIKNERLFVAALGNNTLEVIDLNAGKAVHSITGLNEPQGIVYLPAVDRLYVANAKDGTVRIFDGSTFKFLKSVSYGDDADNLRYDAAADVVYVGYGSGGLGALDKEGEKIADIKLPSHPESFQLEKGGSRIFVNLPKSLKIAVLDRKTSTRLHKLALGSILGHAPIRAC